MKLTKRFRVALLLAVCGLAFLLVQVLLVSRSFDLERRELGMRIQFEANDAFYRAVNEGVAMNRLAGEVFEHPEWAGSEPDRSRVLGQVRRALGEFGGVGATLRAALAKAGIGVPVRHAVTLHTLVFRDDEHGPCVFLEAEDPALGLPIAGDGAEPRSANLNSSFSRMGRRYYLRVNLFLEFPRLTRFALGRMKGLLAVSFLSLAGFLAAGGLILRLIRQQERLSNLQDDFINTMTHELHTPLSTIAVAARNLQDARVRHNPEALDGLAVVIGRQNARLQRMVAGVTRLAQLDDPDQGLRREFMDLHELLAGAAADLRIRYAERSVQVIEDYQAESDRLELDPDLMVTVLFNLLDNAVKYSEGAPLIEIRTRLERGGLVLAIADRGMGIAREHGSRVFERFFRAPEARRVPGLGLGLHTARRIVEAHGGRLIGARRQGGGSLFTIFLPMGNEADGHHPAG